MTFKMTFEMTFESNNDGTNKLDDPEGLSLSVAVIGQLMRQRGPPLDLVKFALPEFSFEFSSENLLFWYSFCGYYQPAQH